MKNRVLNVLLVFACLIAGVPLWGQNAAAARGIRGYLDPQGVFHTLKPQEAAEPPALTKFGGTFVVNFTITVAATISASANIECVVTASLIDNLTSGTPNFIDETAGVVATRSGSTATCSVSVPYSWALGTASTDMVTLSYTIQAPVEYTTATGALPARGSSVGNLATIKVPANGATTTETVTATF